MQLGEQLLLLSSYCFKQRSQFLLSWRQYAQNIKAFDYVWAALFEASVQQHWYLLERCTISEHNKWLFHFQNGCNVKRSYTLCFLSVSRPLWCKSHMGILPEPKLAVTSFDERLLTFSKLFIWPTSWSPSHNKFFFDFMIHVSSENVF